MHFFDTRTHHRNTTSQLHHQEQSSFWCAENKEDKCTEAGENPGLRIFADAGIQARDSNNIIIFAESDSLNLNYYLKKQRNLKIFKIIWTIEEKAHFFQRT